MVKTIQQRVQVPHSCHGWRLDQAAVELFQEYSRSRLQAWIKSAALTIDGMQATPKHKLMGGEWLTLEAELEDQGDWEAENIELDIVYEDESVLVLNKPAGMVVHPAAGNYSGTLLNALLHHCPSLSKVPRAGIVHRLDKDTTGLMMVAKTLPAHTQLVEQLQARSVSREYEAVVQGAITGGGVVNAPIGRHPKQRKLMAVVSHGGKEAITHYRVVKRFPNHTHVRVNLETGRTHQIRVHMTHLGYPLIGDKSYGGRFKIPKGGDDRLVEALKAFPRQALHAVSLRFEHPDHGEPQQFSVPLPDDMCRLLAALDGDFDE